MKQVLIVAMALLIGGGAVAETPVPAGKSIWEVECYSGGTKIFTSSSYWRPQGDGNSLMVTDRAGQTRIITGAACVLTEVTR
ncbi:hypothetical protein JCM17960_01850 [Magnetospira thiophila]